MWLGGIIQKISSQPLGFVATGQGIVIFAGTESKGMRKLWNHRLAA